MNFGNFSVNFGNVAVKIRLKVENETRECHPFANAPRYLTFVYAALVFACITKMFMKAIVIIAQSGKKHITHKITSMNIIECNTKDFIQISDSDFFENRFSDFQITL